LILSKKVVRILSIDGGGIRGLVPSSIIQQWETSLGPIAEKFHMISGTSTGGILACALGQGVAASKLVDFYKTEGPKIFNTSWTTLGGVTGQLYDASTLETAIGKVLSGNISDIGKDLLITAYDIENRLPFMFKNWKAKGYELGVNEHDSEFNFKTKDVARSTSAAPTYFTPAKVKNNSGTVYALIDGGVYANNPALCAYVAAKRLYPNADEYIVVSIGTGAVTKPVKYSEAVNFGILGWARPLLDIIFDGVSGTTEYELSQLPGVTQYRFQTSLEGGSEAMDDVTPENLANLVKFSGMTANKYSAEMTSLLKRLKEPMTSLSTLGYPKKSDAPKPGVLAVSAAKAKAKVTPAVVVGAGGGFLVGGPIGAAIGGVAGYLLDWFHNK
jgi:predicted acylesterase/phospholipase RssA